MEKPYSMDLRERISGYIAAGNSRRAAARVFGFSTAVRLAAEYRDRNRAFQRKVILVPQYPMGWTPIGYGKPTQA